jgi:Holliday junction resolvasome RuvABC endonuclease subunit
MKILAIDPGTLETGWVIYDTKSHTILDKGITENYGLKMYIKSNIGESVFDSVAIEMIASYGMPVGREVFETCLYIGQLMQMMDDAYVPCKLVYRRDVKQAICHNGKAKDKDIRQALIDEFPRTGGGKKPQIGTKNLPGRLYGITSHIWAALGVALTHAKDNKNYKPDINKDLSRHLL